MKKFFSGILILLFFGALSSCSTADSPKEVASKFLSALAGNKFEEAKKLATPESAQMIDMISNLTMNADSTHDERSPKFEMLSEKIEGEVASVTYKVDNENKEEVLKLRKVDNKWLVSMTKQDMNKSDAMGGNDSLEGSEGDLIFPDDSTGTSQGSH